MSYRVFSPKEYPLPYIIEDLNNWPIAKLTQHKEEFLSKVEEAVYEKFKAKFSDETALKAELAKILYQEKIRLTQTPWKADPKDERQFWNNVKSKFIQLDAIHQESSTTPDEILSMVKSLASPPHRILLFLQQSSVEWCSSLWLDAVREIDSSFRRTIVVVSKFDNRLKVLECLNTQSLKLMFLFTNLSFRRSLMIVVRLIVTSVLVGTLGRTLVLTLWPCLKTGALSQTMSFADRYLRWTWTL